MLDLIRRLFPMDVTDIQPGFRFIMDDGKVVTSELDLVVKNSLSKDEQKRTEALRSVIAYINTEDGNDAASQAILTKAAEILVNLASFEGEHLRNIPICAGKLMEKGSVELEALAAEAVGRACRFDGPHLEDSIAFIHNNMGGDNRNFKLGSINAVHNAFNSSYDFNPYLTRAREVLELYSNDQDPYVLTEAQRTLKQFPENTGWNDLLY